MALNVIEGTWEEIKCHEAELAGRHLRVTIIPHHPPAKLRTPSATASSVAIKERLEALNDWLTMPRPHFEHVVDDSRSSIYDTDMDKT